MTRDIARSMLLLGALSLSPATGSAQTCVPYNDIGMWQPQRTVHFTIEGPDGVEKDNIREAVSRQNAYTFNSWPGVLLSEDGGSDLLIRFGGIGLPEQAGRSDLFVSPPQSQTVVRADIYIFTGNRNSFDPLLPYYEHGIRPTTLHELGHTFGLGDMFACDQGSIMNQNCGVNNRDQPSLENPTGCDVTSMYYFYTPAIDPPPGCPWLSCMFNDPLIIDLDGGSIQASEPSTWFDMDGQGHARRFSWFKGDSTAFLVLDRNRTGTIEDGRELFGTQTPMSDDLSGPMGFADGFAALDYFDQFEHGGNGDQVIDGNDMIFGRLLAWSDVSGDGVSQRSELKTLSEVGITSLSLKRNSLGHRRDRYGNIYKYRSDVDSQDGLRIQSVYEVFLKSLP